MNPARLKTKMTVLDIPAYDLVDDTLAELIKGNIGNACKQGEPYFNDIVPVKEGGIVKINTCKHDFLDENTGISLSFTDKERNNGEISIFQTGKGPRVVMGFDKDGPASRAMTAAIIEKITGMPPVKEETCFHKTYGKYSNVTKGEAYCTEPLDEIYSDDQKNDLVNAMLEVFQETPADVSSITVKTATSPFHDREQRKSLMDEMLEQKQMLIAMAEMAKKESRKRGFLRL